MNRQTQSRRHAIVRVFVWAVIMMATAVFWIAAATGLFACIR